MSDNFDSISFVIRSSEISLVEERIAEEDRTLEQVNKHIRSYWTASVDGRTINGPQIQMSREGLTAREAFNKLAAALLEQGITVN